MTAPVSVELLMTVTGEGNTEVNSELCIVK